MPDLSKISPKLDKEYDFLLDQCKYILRKFRKFKGQEMDEFRQNANDSSDREVISCFLSEPYFVEKVEHLLKKQFTALESKKSLVAAFAKFVIATRLYSINKTKACQYLCEAIVVCPRNSLFVQILRLRIHCYYSLGLTEQCTEDILLLHTFKIDESLKREMEVFNILCYRKTAMSSSQNKPLDFTATGNEEMEDASKELTIIVNPEKGRCVKTTKSMTPGTLLVAQDPASFWLRPTLYPFYCNHCCRKLQLSVYPCTQCADVRYCSIRCQSKAWNEYHSVECKHVSVLKKCSIGMMAMRLALVYGLSDSQETETKEKNATRFGNNRPSVLSLVSTFNYSDGNFRMLIAVASIILAKLADKMDLIFFKPDKFLSTATSMCNYIYKVIANCYYIYDEKVSRTNYWNIISTCSETFEIGIGLYTTASLFAHSCEANAYRFCVGNKIVLLSSVDIENGEEVCIDYGIKHVDTCQTERITYLKFTFGFICKCKACKNKWENISHALICPQCDGALIVTASIVQNYCLKCNAKDVDFTRSTSYIQRSVESSNNAKFYYKIGHYRKALKYLEKWLHQNSQGYYYGRFDLDLTLKIARCAVKAGEIEKAGEMYLKSLLLHKVMCGDESLEFINRLFEFMEFLNGYERYSVDETFDYKANYENAILLLKKTINREVVSATQSRLKFLKNIRLNAPYATANIFKSINE